VPGLHQHRPRIPSKTLARGGAALSGHRERGVIYGLIPVKAEHHIEPCTPHAHVISNEIDVTATARTNRHRGRRRPTACLADPPHRAHGGPMHRRNIRTSRPSTS